MNLQIRAYNQDEDYHKLLELISSEGDEWKSYLEPRYKSNLEHSTTLVAFVNDQLCGYSRALEDKGYFIWVLDLLVHKDYRGHSIGKKLMDQMRIDFPGHDVYVMSDVDEYYAKMGFKKEGSIFKVE
ncbi:MAG: GNAT family N-acetyltransferase [Flavobacteriales bacterium]|nr:GNAT family N-acetyltransferase [Flavobacteriales bacterium]